MAKMIPPYIGKEVKSNGEKQIFELFKNGPYTNDWVVLHSLALNQHVKRMYGEIDFLVLAPNLGVFCLEVKSGNVNRIEGLWKFTNRFGQSNTKTRGPFEQAQEGMFSLISAIKRKFGNESKLGRVICGYGVMFPHILFEAGGTDQEGWKIYDRDSKRLPISNYIKKLSQMTLHKMDNSGWVNVRDNLPNESDIQKLVSFLRGDFEKFVTLNQKADDINDQMNKYTEEQYRCLDQMIDNPRCLFQGAAGTGKTMIAIESVKRKLHQKKRVLFICFNSLLGVWLSSQFEDFKSDDFFVGTFHQLLEKISLSSNEYLNYQSNRNDEYYKYDLPLLALEEIDKGVIEPFDTVIIDEGQDLLRSEYLDTIGSLIKGGLSGGSFEIYCDFERQAIYSELTPQEMQELLADRASFVKFKLTTNCRNTKYIGEETSLISGFASPPYLPAKIEGLPVEYYFCKDISEQTTKLKMLLNKLKLDKIPSNQITILSPFIYRNSCVSKINQDDTEIVDLSLTKLKTGKPSVTFSTIQGFKGMENKYIILVDINRLNDEKLWSLFYVGMSRAQVGLYIFVDHKEKNEYKKIQRRRFQ